MLGTPINTFRSMLNTPAIVRPVNVSIPVVSGNLISGQTLSVSNGTWSGTPSPTYTYLWKHGDGSAAANLTTTGMTYRLVAGDVGYAMVCQVTATNANGTATASSIVTSTVV